MSLCVEDHEGIIPMIRKQKIEGEKIPNTELMFVDNEIRNAVMPRLMETCAKKEGRSGGRFNEDLETLGKTRAEEALIFYDIMKTCESLFDDGILKAIKAEWIIIDDPQDNTKRMPSLRPQTAFADEGFYKTQDVGDIILNKKNVLKTRVLIHRAHPFFFRFRQLDGKQSP